MTLLYKLNARFNYLTERFESIAFNRTNSSWQENMRATRSHTTMDGLLDYAYWNRQLVQALTEIESLRGFSTIKKLFKAEKINGVLHFELHAETNNSRKIAEKDLINNHNEHRINIEDWITSIDQINQCLTEIRNAAYFNLTHGTNGPEEQRIGDNHVFLNDLKKVFQKVLKDLNVNPESPAMPPLEDSPATPDSSTPSPDNNININLDDIVPQELFPEEELAPIHTTAEIDRPAAKITVPPMFFRRPAQPLVEPAVAEQLPPRKQQGGLNNNGVAPLPQRLVPPAPRPVPLTTHQRRQPNNVPANNHLVPPVLVSPHSVNNIPPRQPRNPGPIDNMRVPQNVPFVPPIVVPANPAPAASQLEAPMQQQALPRRSHNIHVQPPEVVLPRLPQQPQHDRIDPADADVEDSFQRQHNNNPAGGQLPAVPVMPPALVNNISRQPHPLGQVPSGNMQATPPHYIVRVAMSGSQTGTVLGPAYMPPESPIERLLRLLRAVTPGHAGINERNTLLFNHKEVISTGTYQQQQEVGNHINHLTEQGVMSFISWREIAVAVGRRTMKHTLAC